MKFTYQEVKDISMLIEAFQKEYWVHRSMHDKDYPFENLLPLNLLDEIIYRLKEVSNIKSKYADFIELKSDIDFIEEYYEIKKFPNVNIWLSNTNSTLRETFSSYIEQVKKVNHYEKSRNEN